MCDSYHFIEHGPMIPGMRHQVLHGFVGFLNIIWHLSMEMPHYDPVLRKLRARFGITEERKNWVGLVPSWHGLEDLVD